MTIMTAGNAPQPRLDVAQVADLARRVYRLLQRPDVRRAWHEAFLSAGAALTAASNAVSETRTAWPSVD